MIALIENYEGREDGGYTRIFGDAELGKLFSKVQGAVIASGSELEKMIISRCKTIEDLDNFLESEHKNGIYLLEKKLLKIQNLRLNKNQIL